MIIINYSRSSFENKYFNNGRAVASLGKYRGKKALKNPHQVVGFFKPEVWRTLGFKWEVGGSIPAKSHLKIL